jgi:uracil-DNA glycosylase family 4
MSKSKADRLERIAQEVRDLEDSPLYQYRVENGYRAVIGEGDLDATIVFVGEAPGRQEAKTGRPFVGAAGQILDELLASIKIAREDVYITNVVKDRPPGNRDPTAKEIELYGPFLMRQLEIIRPRIVATLGRFAMRFIFGQFDLADKGDKISKLHGQIFAAEAPFNGISIVPLYHPAVALYNPDRKETLLQDFQVLSHLT